MTDENNNETYLLNLNYQDLADLYQRAADTGTPPEELAAQYIREGIAQANEAEGRSARSSAVETIVVKIDDVPAAYIVEALRKFKQSQVGRDLGIG